jgi:hypothetical protein
MGRLGLQLKRLPSVPQIEADYSMSVNDIYMAVTQHMINRANTLDVIRNPQKYLKAWTKPIGCAGLPGAHMH